MTPADLSRLRELVTKWRNEATVKDSFHATMGIGWKACAAELDALVSGTPETPTAEGEALAAIRAFMAKWPTVEKRINGIFVLHQLRTGVVYNGPSIKAELERFEAILAAAPVEGETASPSEKGK